ncbi:MAG: NAD(P)/FAD-dependent oxidoreductase [Acholeplasmataceae bacterium]|nr:MAG: NAD(P)/FAD-dependent oxidoreductase [Acholeplasmataceae bacterium]
MMNNPRRYDAVIVGGGIAGLTAASYLSKYGYMSIVLEQQDIMGGLINSFDYQGFHFDGGIRSIESSGVLIPMIRDLGLDLDFRRSPVTLGIEDQVIALSTPADITAYEALLVSIFPENREDIRLIIRKIKRILRYMNVLYGIDNPMMVDLKANPSYVLKTLFPWFFKFVPTLYHIERLSVPVESYLRKYTSNQALMDMIAQHFFKDTPAFFALGYFSIYFDYHYPQGGTGQLPRAMVEYISHHGGLLKTGTKITSINLDDKVVSDSSGEQYPYHKLIWAADLKSMYRMIELDHLNQPKVKQKVVSTLGQLKNKRGAESVLTVYALVDLEPRYFKDRSSGHFFYTPQSVGLGQIKLPKTDTLELFVPHLKTFLALNTFEISIPVLRDERLAPDHKTGLIISILIDHETVLHIEKMGYYTSFKSCVQNLVIDILSTSIYPGLKDHVIDMFCATPLTIEKRTGSTDGAIIGWSYANKPIPVAHRMSRITRSVQTGLPDVLMAGQWSFSPAGVPISVITGKLAADATKKHLKKIKRSSAI